MGRPTDADYHMIRDIWVDWYKVTTHNSDVVVVDTKDECGIDGGVDQSKQVCLAL